MMQQESHIDDAELIQFLDGELAAQRAAAVQAHLAQCGMCRVRSGEFENSVGALVRWHRENLDNRIPPIEPAEARLRAQMSAAARQKMMTPWWRRHAVAAMVSGLMVGISALVWLSGERATAGYLPNARLTPGATRAISKEQVCAASADVADRQVPRELAQQVFQQYGIGKPLPKAYEVDYLITPALGGADDIRNLWPQPYANGVWTARVKDALEDHLKGLVCGGRADLLTVQQEIAADWVAAYRKYFRTEQPLAAHASFVKDRPWE